MKNYLSFFNFSRYSAKQKHIAINIIWGIALAFLAHHIEDTVNGQKLVNQSLDFYIRHDAEKTIQRSKDPNALSNDNVSDKIVFIDIDHETYQKWGEPLLTPRDKLSKIVEYAYKGGADIIVFDTLFEDKDCCHPEFDRQLRKILSEMIEKRSRTKVIFPVRVTTGGTDQHDNVKVRKSIFSDLINKNPNFYCALPYFSDYNFDRVIRYWNSYKTIEGDRDRRVLWNMSLLTVLLESEKQQELIKLEQKIIKKEFAEAQHIAVKKKIKIGIYPPGEGEVDSNRIRFHLIPKNTLENHPEGNVFTMSYTFDELNQINFQGKIVIVGNSSPDAGDIHQTPVGNMAGMYINGNIINTLILGKQITSMPAIIAFIFEIPVIIFAAWLFYHIDSTLASWAGKLIVIGVLGVISWYLFIYYGILLNFMFAVAGMGYHSNIAVIENALKKKTVLNKSH